jgi:energy-converting hydrogenase Eha subunit C
MDVRFLKEISEAYVMDTELNEQSESVFNILYDTVRYVRQCDLDLYNELYELDRIYQQKILKGYLDLYYGQESVSVESDNELLSEVELSMTLSGTFIASIVAAIIALLTRKPLSKTIFKTLSFLGKILSNVGKFIVTRGRYMQLRYAIVQQNASKCYIKCGISSPKDISALTYFTITSKSSFGTKKSLEQGKCLRECYISNLIEVISLHMESYFACLKRTGGFAAIQRTDPDEIIRMISSTNIGTVCQEHYNIAKDALDSFYKILDLVYTEEFDDSIKLQWVNTLRSRLYDVREQVRKLDDNTLQRYNQNDNRPQNQNFNRQQQNQNFNRSQQQNQNR